MSKKTVIYSITWATIMGAACTGFAMFVTWDWNLDIGAWSEIGRSVYALGMIFAVLLGGAVGFAIADD